MSAMARFHRLMRDPRNSRKSQRGMTLLEIMVVITIIGVVMGAVAVAVIPMMNKAKIDATKNNIRTVETGLKLYYARHGKYPDTSGGLNLLATEKMLDKNPKDAWGNEFTYLNEGGKYKIISYGADGAPGGDEDNADITSDTMDQQDKKN